MKGSAASVNIKLRHLECIDNADLVHIREQFSTNISKINAELLNTEKYGLTKCLKLLTSAKDTVSRVSQLAHDVLEVYDKFPIYVPTSITGIAVQNL
jgi:hypothetical protein